MFFMPARATMKRCAELCIQMGGNIQTSGNIQMGGRMTHLL